MSNKEPTYVQVNLEKQVGFKIELNISSLLIFLNFTKLNWGKLSQCIKINIAMKWAFIKKTTWN